MEDIITAPPRIQSLYADRIQVIQHNSYTSTTTYNLMDVYPFETLFTLKQRIALHHKTKSWLPKSVFIAKEVKEGVYTPIEFQWPFADTLKDPFSPTVLGDANPNLWADDARKAVFPTLLSRMTVESAIETVIHVWNLESIATALKITADSPPSEAVFQGFLQLYFPLLDTQDAIKQALGSADEEDKQRLDTAETYRKEVDARLSRIQRAITSLGTESTALLKNLWVVTYNLPKKDKFATGILELKFYDMEPSDAVPFIRYFPARSRSAPLVKLAVTSRGTAKIEDKKLLSLFLADQPDTKDGAVIVLKSPIKSRDTFGTTWTVRIYETGKGELELLAPRKDSPLAMTVVKDAIQMVNSFMKDTPWPDATPELSELQAEYQFTTTHAEGKPTLKGLQARLPVFASLFESYTPVEKDADKSAIYLRYKAISNFSQEQNPIQKFITNMVQQKPISMEGGLDEDDTQMVSKEFGLTLSEAKEEIDEWLSKHEEGIELDESTVPLHSAGASIKINYQNHPLYSFNISNVESKNDLTRIMTFLITFVSNTAEQLQGEGKVVAAEAVAATSATAAAAAAPEPEVELTEEELLELGIDPEEYAAAAAAAAQAPPAAEASAEAAPEGQRNLQRNITTVIGRDEVLQPIGDSWYLKRLIEYDKELFEYTARKEDVRLQSYSRKCQASANKQPHVMAPETYRRARKEYEGDVFWVESPFDHPDFLEAIRVASKSKGQRGRDTTEILKLEKIALRLGFPLAGDESVAPDDPEIVQLKQAQINPRTNERKPLWTVLRIGTNETKPNFYMCAEYWCIREDFPLIPSDFKGTRMRNGSSKPENTCPFCRGSEIIETSTPRAGETVIIRKTTVKGGDKVAHYVGFQDKLYHPDNFAMPCCFVSPDDLVFPKGAQPAPKPGAVVDLPAAQQEMIHVVQEPKKETKATVQVQEELQPFHVKRTGGYKNTYYVPSQNVLGRITKEWFELARGTVGVPPESVNSLLRQSPENFLTNIKGVMQEGPNSRLKSNTHAFVRYSLGTTNTNTSILSLIAYARYASDYQSTGESSKTSIESEDKIKKFLFDKKKQELQNAFEQANYGTLIHEFDIAADSEDQSPTAKRDRAWANFEKYMVDDKISKDLRLWEALFATPKLLTDSGFILVRILFPKDKDEPARILCPEFGISLANQIGNKLPLLFIIIDEKTGMYDPLVFYEGTETGVEKHEKKTLMGLIHPKYTNTLTKPVKDSLNAFFEHYFSNEHGCGRKVEPVHPWILNEDQSGIPLLSTIQSKLTSSHIIIQGLVKDLTHRTVGVWVQWDGKQVHMYLPVRDDGIVLPQLPSYYDKFAEASEKPVIADAFKILKAHFKSSPALVDHFSGYEPIALVASAGSDGETKYRGIRLKCGAIIPIKPAPLNRESLQSLFTDEQEMITDVPDKMQWEADDTLGLKGTITQTDEEHLEESYQYVRISFSNWLHDKKQTKAADVRNQIEVLRKSRQRLPLYMVQERLEKLLDPIVRPMLTSEGPQGIPSVLRRDCLKSTKEKCVAGCTWVAANKSCLIHTIATQRYKDPIKLLIVRLVDELIRSFGYAEEILEQRVPYLKPLIQGTMLHEGETALLSVVGRGTDTLYEQLGYMSRKPSTYTRGHTYPEEVPADWLDVMQPTTQGGGASSNHEDWKQLAKTHSIDVLHTAIRPDTLAVVVTTWMGSKTPPQEERRFVILDTKGMPFQSNTTHSHIMRESELPVSIAMWLEAHMPMPPK